MIFDTNILIYISKQILRVEELLSSDIKPQISVISYIEALGFQFATDQEKNFMQQICDTCQIVNLSDEIIQKAITIRSNFKIKLPDAIIYATASVQKLPLLTNNISDFVSLDNQVALIDPFSI